MLTAGLGQAVDVAGAGCGRAKTRIKKQAKTNRGQLSLNLNLLFIVVCVGLLACRLAAAAAAAAAAPGKHQPAKPATALVSRGVTVPDSARRAGRAPKTAMVRPMLSGERRIVLASTINGTLAAVDLADGSLLWSYSSGPMLSGKSQLRPNDGRSAPVFLPDPHDGSLYVAVDGRDRLLRLDMNIRQLVDAAPFSTSEHTYLGQKRTQVSVFDLVTGVARALYHPENTDFNTNQQNWAKTPAEILVGRTEYALAVFNRSTNELLLNVTLAEFADPHMQLGADALVEMGICPEGSSIVASGDTLIYGSAAQGWQRSKALDGEIVGLYIADALGCLRQVPLPKVRFSHALHQKNHPIVDSAANGDVVLQLASSDDGVLYATRITPFEAQPKAVAVPAVELQVTADSKALAAVSRESDAADVYREACLHNKNLPWCGHHPDYPLLTLVSAPGQPQVPGIAWMPERALAPRSVEVESAPVAGASGFLWTALATVLSLVVASIILWLRQTSRSTAAAQAAEMAARQNATAATVETVDRGVSPPPSAALTPTKQSRSKVEEDVEDSGSDDETEEQLSTSAGPLSAGTSGSEGGKSTNKKRRKRKAQPASSGVVAVTTTPSEGDSFWEESASADNGDPTLPPPPPLLTVVPSANNSDANAQLLAGGSFPRVLNKLTVYRTTLGHGSHGTVVYTGKYENHPVAVKRILHDFVTLAETEVDLLRRSDRHPHVIRYYCMESDAQFLYIALEQCIATLEEVVHGPRTSTGGTKHGGGADPQRLAQLDRQVLSRQFLDGLSHLHKLNIVHRDVKPQNVLLNVHYEVVISDFGLCRNLTDNQQSFLTNTGTIGWTAPEALLDKRMTKALDVFSAGCVIHYLMHGQHPFGPYYERESNIRNNKLSLHSRGNQLLDDLLAKMLQWDADKRITAEEALRHPYFWDNARLLAFLMDVSDRVEKEPAHSPLVQALENGAAEVVGANWSEKISDLLLVDLKRFRNYNWSLVVDLLRAARNKKHHYQELSAELKTNLGSVPDGFLQYFTSRFPRLLPHVYNQVRSTSVAQESLFQQYFQH